MDRILFWGSKDKIFALGKWYLANIENWPLFEPTSMIVSIFFKLEINGSSSNSGEVLFRYDL